MLISTTQNGNGAELNREGKSHQISSAIQTGGAFGMQTIDTALRKLFRSGVISKEAAEA